jgi:hypothetical protein
MRYAFRLPVFLSLLLVAPLLAPAGQVPVTIDRKQFYAAIASTDPGEVDRALIKLQEEQFLDKDAFEGALLMKKAGLVRKAGEKLKLFKAGRAKLEQAIKNDEANAEYRFLRLVIQENSPGIVRYKAELRSDSAIVRAAFPKLDPVVRQAVRDYAKKSRFLKEADF